MTMVVLSWKPEEPLGFTLKRDLSVEGVEGDKQLIPGQSLLAVNGVSVVGFAYEGALALLEKSHKKAGSTLRLEFSPVPTAARAAAAAAPAAAPPPAADTAPTAPAAVAPAAPAATPATQSIPTNFADLVKHGSSGPTSVEFNAPGSIGIHFGERLADDRQPLIIVKIAPDSQASAQPSLAVGMSLELVQGKSVADMSYAETLDLIRAAGRPLMLRFHAARRVTKETAGTVTNCAVVGSRLVEASGFFSRPHTVYCVVATTSEGIFSAELRFSDVCDFHGRWGAVVMSESNPLVLPPKDISYALKNTPETVKQRQLGIQSYFDAAFMMIGRMRSPSFAAAMQAFVHGRDVPPPSAQVVASGWDPVGEWRHQLSVQFFDSEYSVPHCLYLRPDMVARFVAKGHPKHGGSVALSGKWSSIDEGNRVKVHMTSSEAKDSSTVTSTITYTIRKSTPGGYGMNINADGVVMSYSESNSAAKTAGVTIGSSIVAVNGKGVANKDQLLGELASAAEESTFTLLVPKTSNTKQCSTTIILEKQQQESKSGNAFALYKARRVLVCVSAATDGNWLDEGKTLQLSEHYAWPSKLQ